MSQSQSQTTFAYGGNEIEGCFCPAMAAGMNPCGVGDNHTPGLLEAAEHYDALIQEKEGGYQGTVGEEIAKSAWLQMLRNADEDEMFSETAAEKVAKELNWL